MRTSLTATLISSVSTGAGVDISLMPTFVKTEQTCASRLSTLTLLFTEGKSIFLHGTLPVYLPFLLLFSTRGERFGNEIGHDES